MSEERLEARLALWPELVAALGLACDELDAWVDEEKALHGKEYNEADDEAQVAKWRQLLARVDELEKEVGT